MIKYPSIAQSRQVLPSIVLAAQFTHIDPETQAPCYDKAAQLPVLECRGTVKLHGSNAAIVQNIDDSAFTSVHFQSRERVLTPQNDLLGFCAYMMENSPSVEKIFRILRKSCNKDSYKVQTIAVFGEWCGIGVQKGVAISGLPKMFVIFAVKVSYQQENTQEEAIEWVDLHKLLELKDEKARIFNIMQFPTFSMEIDFNDEAKVEEARTKMEELTLRVEKECPVGKHFDITGTGEGIVWQVVASPNLPAEKQAYYCDSRFWFKVKGEKHTSYRKPGLPKPVKTMSPEKAQKINKLMELVVTPARLGQGLQVLEREMLLPLEITSIGAFMRWVQADIMKEEYDRIGESGVSKSDVDGGISRRTKQWYLEWLEEEALKKGER